MAITDVDSGTSLIAGATGSGTVNFNITPNENDVVVLWEARDDAAPTWTGYTAAGANGDGRLLYKRMSASPDTGASFSGNVADIALHFWILRGVDTTTAEDATAMTGSGTGTVPDGPSITTVTNGAWVGTFARQYFSANATAAPTGYSNFLAADQGIPNGMGAWKQVDTAGAEDPGAFTADVADWTAVTWAVRPAIVVAAAVFAGSFVSTPSRSGFKPMGY